MSINLFGSWATEEDGSADRTIPIDMKERSIKDRHWITVDPDTEYFLKINLKKRSKQKKVGIMQLLVINS